MAFVATGRGGAEPTIAALFAFDFFSEVDDAVCADAKDTAKGETVVRTRGRGDRASDEGRVLRKRARLGRSLVSVGWGFVGGRWGRRSVLGLDEMSVLGLIEGVFERSVRFVLVKLESVVDVDGRRERVADVRLRHGVDSGGEGCGQLAWQAYKND